MNNMGKSKMHLFRPALVFFIVLFFTACVSTGNQSSSNTAKVRGDDKAIIHTRLAEGYLKQKQYAVAKSELEKALRINPNHSPSNYVMALLMIELEQYDVAQDYFEKSVKADKNNSSAAHDFGTFLCQRGQELRSVEMFELAVSNPFFERPELSYMRAGECLARINDDRAEGYLKKALSINAQMRPALYRLAQIKFKNRSYLSARAYIERFFAITKPQPASLLLAYKIESKLKANEIAEKYRTTLLEQFPGSRQASTLRQKSRN